MKIAYEQDDFSSALSYAQIILDNPNTDNYIKGDAQIITARCAFALGNEDLARTAYAKVASSENMNYGAEVKYYDAFFQNKDRAYAKSNDLIQELIQQYPSNKIFAGKGLILMAKNYFVLVKDKKDKIIGRITLNDLLTGIQRPRKEIKKYA